MRLKSSKTLIELIFFGRSILNGKAAQNIPDFSRKLSGFINSQYPELKLYLHEAVHDMESARNTGLRLKSLLYCMNVLELLLINYENNTAQQNAVEKSPVMLIHCGQNTFVKNTMKAITDCGFSPVAVDILKHDDITAAKELKVLPQCRVIQILSAENPDAQTSLVVRFSLFFALKSQKHIISVVEEGDKCSRLTDVSHIKNQSSLPDAILKQIRIETIETNNANPHLVMVMKTLLDHC
ncbi:MAG: hypothetical protein GXY05_16490 [Clostridiales bacterium]|nr:hypothetical protein [Clostridiales bacterium]